MNRLSYLLLACFLPLISQLSGQLFNFKDPQYIFQSLRTIAGTAVGAADIQECLITISQIPDNNDELWHTQWLALAQRVEGEARQSQKDGRELSAKAEFSRASNYYRTAEFFLHSNPNDPRILPTWAKSKECCREAIKNLPSPVVEVRIPFERTTLPAYLCRVDNSDVVRPLLIVQTGFDGTAEELYFNIAKAAITRGYHCLVFEGPGQGEVIRVQGMPFRYNWETVIKPIVDYAIALKGVDKDRIALMGLSMGGYLVPRALAFEKRIKLGIANGGVYDFHEVCMQGAPPDTEKKLDDPKAAKELDAQILTAMKPSAALRWAISQGMYSFKATSPSDWLKMTRSYTLKAVAPYISCRMLIVNSENDAMMKGQAKRLYDALQSPKDFMIFTTIEGAGEHCQVGAYSLSNEQIFNWIDKHL